MQIHLYSVWTVNLAIVHAATIAVFIVCTLHDIEYMIYFMKFDIPFLVPYIWYELWTLYLHVLLFFSNLGDLWTTFRNLAEKHKTTEIYSVLQDKRFTSNGIHIKLYFGKIYRTAFYEKNQYCFSQSVCQHIMYMYEGLSKSS